MSHPRNVIYAQAGGVTAVINASAAGVIEMVKRHPEKFGKVYAAINGIVGVLEERLTDASRFSEDTLDRLKTQPGAAFQACRFDLDGIDENPGQYQRVLEVFRTYDIGYFFYNAATAPWSPPKKWPTTARPTAIPSLVSVWRKPSITTWLSRTAARASAVPLNTLPPVCWKRRWTCFPCTTPPPNSLHWRPWGVMWAG